MRQLKEAIYTLGTGNGSITELVSGGLEIPSQASVSRGHLLTHQAFLPGAQQGLLSKRSRSFFPTVWEARGWHREAGPPGLCPHSSAHWAASSAPLTCLQSPHPLLPPELVSSALSSAIPLPPPGP